jgi:hypothetical protein
MSKHQIIEAICYHTIVMTTLFLPIEANRTVLLVDAISKIHTRHDGLACVVYQVLSDGQIGFSIYGLSTQVTEIAIEITMAAMETKFKKHHATVRV